MRRAHQMSSWYPSAAAPPPPPFVEASAWPKKYIRVRERQKGVLLYFRAPPSLPLSPNLNATGQNS